MSLTLLCFVPLLWPGGRGTGWIRKPSRGAAPGACGGRRTHTCSRDHSFPSAAAMVPSLCCQHPGCPCQAAGRAQSCMSPVPTGRSRQRPHPARTAGHPTRRGFTGPLAGTERLTRFFCDYRFALASHFFWGLWSIVQAKISAIEFGYMVCSEQLSPFPGETLWCTGALGSSGRYSQK